MLLIAMIFVWSAALSFLTRAEVECDAPAVLIPAILDGNSGYVLPRPYLCASVFDRMWAPQRIHEHTGGVMCRLDGGIDSVLESEVSNLSAAHGQNTAERSIVHMGQ